MILRPYLQDKQEEEREKARESARKTHKCHGCVWGTWVGNKYVCSFGSCVKRNPSHNTN
ncbi:hypothetical protein P9D81_01185 [Bacillus haynesii]|uniref:hypothetical protein n=1 Tax=Bacillus TaxID=1386 RepID=UPI0015CE587F|nr:MULTISPECIES: hypothetical protein [Bacillus]MEC0633412.1 hypothetical protein [Bacillus haynesii]MEC1653494.1 hypothetical protein [Bacillus haynesii]MED0806610.1 hypothetical protein [Bacillus paralicheniformis]